MGLTASNVQELKQIELKLNTLLTEKERYELTREWTDDRQEIASDLSQELYARFMEIVSVEVPVHARRQHSSKPKRDIAYFERLYPHGGPIPFSSQFRFYGGDYLRAIIHRCRCTTHQNWRT